MKSEFKNRIALAALVVAFLWLCAYYNFSLPLFEGYDEISHYRVASYYADHFALPDLTRAPSHEAHQPPLYYALGGMLIRGIDRSDLDATFQVDPNAGLNHRQNGMPTDASFAPSGTTLAVRVLRMFSSLLGAGCVLLAYAIASRLTRSRGAGLLAAAVLAFNPKFIYLSSMVSNDVATACAAALALLVMTRLVTQSSRASIWQAPLLGGLIGLAALCKLSGVALLLPAAFAILLSELNAKPRFNFAALVARGLLALIGFALVAGWFFAYQFSKYGNPLAMAQVNALNVFSLRPAPLNTAQILAALPPILPTFWQVNTPSIQPLVDGFAALVLLFALMGLAKSRASLPLGKVIALFSVAIAASVIALVPWMRDYGGTEDARLLSPAFISVSVLVGMGLYLISEQAFLKSLAVGAFAIWSALVPLVAIRPNYPALPAMPASQIVRHVSQTELAALPPFAPVRFENGIELVSAQVKNVRLGAGQPLQVALVWRVFRAPIQSYDFTLDVMDAQNRSLGHLNAPPLDGKRGTNLWQVGDVFRDEVSVNTQNPSPSQPALASVYLGWHASDPPNAIIQPEGRSEASVPLGQVKLRAQNAAGRDPITKLQVKFGEVIELGGYDLTGNQLVLFWRGLAAPEKAYSVFIHVLDASGVIVAQADGQPSLPTSFWDAGEQVIDARQIAIPQNATSVRVGLYDPAGGARLPALGADGKTWPDNSVLIWSKPAP